MAQAIQEWPPDPVVYPSCEYCTAGDEPKRREHGEPRVHVIGSAEREQDKQRVICPLHNHPLIVKRFTRVSDWGNWRRLWDEAQTYEQLLGLLHVGLDVSRYKHDWQDPILFYLALADDWKTGQSSSAHEKTTLNLLKAKAWQVLVMHHWKLDKDHQWQKDQTWGQFLTPALIDPILTFFLKDSSRNLPRPDSEVSENRVAYSFVEWFLEILWQRATIAALRCSMADRTRREKFMLLLIKMEKFNKLLEPDGGLTRTDRRFLKRLALAGTDQGTTLWQVAAGVIKDYQKRGNPALARTLANDFIRRRELARLARVNRVERKKKQEQDHQEAIAKAAADAAAAAQRLMDLTGNPDKQ